MTLDEIRGQLENADGLPVQALTAAVSHAAALAPDVIAVVNTAAGGVWLLPRQEKLLLFGLHVLAAAQDTSGYPAFMALLRRPEGQPDGWLGDAVMESGSGLLLGLYDGNADPIYAAIEDSEVDGVVKWFLFQVLARLTWEKRAPRDRFIDLIDRFDRDAMAPAGDLAWEGWQDAIVYLGLKHFEARVRQGWQAGRMPDQNEADCLDWLERLAHAAAHPDDPRYFIGDGVMPIADPVASLAWMDEDESGGDIQSDGTDPAAAIRLTEREQEWLDGFLASGRAPETAMTLEELDGFFTALVAGPEPVPQAEYMGSIWGTENGEGPAYDSSEQAHYVHDLLTRHWNTIACRLEAGFPHAPWLFPDAAEEMGRLWAQGFTVGIGLRHNAWMPLVQDEEGGALPILIFALVADENDEDDEPLTADARAEILEALPVMILAIRDYWRGERTSLQRYLAARPIEVGRDEPCLCGSGREYRQCCGAAADQAVQ